MQLKYIAHKSRAGELQEQVLVSLLSGVGPFPHRWDLFTVSSYVRLILVRRVVRSELTAVI